MIIAQGSIAIDENAKLANDAVNHADSNKRQVESLLGGKITQSTLAPGDAHDTNKHQDGDLWIQVGSDGTAINMFNYTNGAWVPHHWDAQALSVKQLSALTADLGTINTGTINSVTINGVELNIDIDGDGGAHDSGINPRQWTAGDNWLNNGMDMGFHFQNGLMRWRGQRVGGDGTYDATFIGPNDIKVRNSNDNTTSSTSINSRADILSDSITVSHGYNPPSKGSLGCSMDALGNATVGQTLTTTRVILDDINHQGDSFWIYQGKGGIGGDFFSGGTIGANVALSAPSVFGQLQNSSSDLSKKDHIEYFDDKSALSEVMGTDIYKYKYNGDNDNLHVGPIIDDVNDTKDAHYNMSEYLITRDDKMGNSFKLKNGIGLLFGAVHELTKQNEKLLARITQLEMKQNGNN